MNIGNLETPLSKRRGIDFFYQHKNEIFSLLRLLCGIWTCILAFVYFSIPEIPAVNSKHLDLHFYLSQSSNAFIVGSVLSLLALPMFIVYEQVVLKYAIIVNLIIVVAMGVYVRYMPISDAQVQRYEGCLNKLLNLDDESKEIAFERAKKFKELKRSSLIESEIKSCHADSMNAVARINQSLYGNIAANKTLTVNQIAASGSKSTSEGFTLAQEDKLVSCLNDLLSGDEMAANSAKWMLRDLDSNGITQSAEQYIVQCESNMALYKGKYKETDSSLFALIQKHKNQ